MMLVPDTKVDDTSGGMLAIVIVTSIVVMLYVRQIVWVGIDCEEVERDAVGEVLIEVPAGNREVEVCKVDQPDGRGLAVAVFLGEDFLEEGCFPVEVGRELNNPAHGLLDRDDE
jgi:hypothetical protein